jgi:selenide,water dikinase
METTTKETVKLSAYSHGAGCGCKLSPAQLDEVLSKLESTIDFPQLLVGSSTKDDAAVFDLGDGRVLLSTVDFFMPIVDDAFDFGQVAATNAINDIYAMGGSPIFALAMLGWPVGKLPPALATEVLRGAQQVCKEHGIPLAGGHSIDNLEPLFGLAVNGITAKKSFITNRGARPGDVLYLTKPLGTGILATALKRGLATPEHIAYLTQTMLASNKVGAHLANVNGIHALTDVTGFGLIGHLIELCEAANCSASINFENVPQMDQTILKPYLDAFVIPDNTFRNYSSYAQKVNALSAVQMQILCDPQTSGGLLISVDPSAAEQLEILLKSNDSECHRIGEMLPLSEKVVQVT